MKNNETTTIITEKEQIAFDVFMAKYEAEEFFAYLATISTTISST